MDMGSVWDCYGRYIRRHCRDDMPHAGEKMTDTEECALCAEKDKEILRLTQRLAAIKCVTHHIGPLCQQKLKELLNECSGCSVEEIAAELNRIKGE